MRTASQRGRRNRQKGQEFEREVASIFSLKLGRDVCRILGQERDGGCDITVPPLRLECKRRKRIGVEEWLRTIQVAPGETPVVVMRGDGASAKVMLYLDDFLNLVGDKLR